MTANNRDHWGHLAERYKDKRPRKMLALDGGGIRGLMTVRTLIRLEELLAAGRGGSDFRLCHYFDYIGGTSTGAIIAAALARGMSAHDLLEFYQDFGRQAFTKRSLFARWKSLYENGELAQNKSAATSYMVSTHFARLSKPNDRDRIAFVYPACNERYFTLWP